MNKRTPRKQMLQSFELAYRVATSEQRLKRFRQLRAVASVKKNERRLLAQYFDDVKADPLAIQLLPQARLHAQLEAMREKVLSKTFLRQACDQMDITIANQSSDDTAQPAITFDKDGKKFLADLSSRLNGNPEWAAIIMSLLDRIQEETRELELPPLPPAIIDPAVDTTLPPTANN